MTKLMRCAIYTRKSSEEGLEQDFNSLHAQREACEAYIKSQKHEGWQLIKMAYDDGGISGGTMQRPALQRLLDDIRAGKVDVIVVYKVDRLTRALADFARMVELFDQHGVSFVAVTQQFNTTSSMGRLTLNVLLSFAQFEREVTGERIRDKIKASKEKGMFMGGRVPLGYRVEGRKLRIVPEDAELVRTIFRFYLEAGNVRLLKEKLDGMGLHPKPQKIDGQRHFSQFSRGALYTILGNITYLGKVLHKGTIYDGQQDAIVDQELWNQVQTELAANRHGAKKPTRKTEPAPLAKKLFDSDGTALVRVDSSKRGRRYRYYISQKLLIKSDGTGWRLPGREIEAALVTATRKLMTDPSMLVPALSEAAVPPAAVPEIIKASVEAADRLADGLVMQLVIEKAVLSPDGVTLTLQLIPEPNLIRVKRFIPLHIKRRGVEMRLIIPSDTSSPVKIDRGMLKAIARGHTWFDDWCNGKVTSIREIAAREGVSKSHVGDVIRLAFLSPKMVEAIIAGRQPTELTLDGLIKTSLPFDWHAQKLALGF